MSEKVYNLICSYLHVHRGAHFQHQVDDNHRYYDNAFTWVCIDKFSWNLKFDVGFLNAFLLEKYYIKIGF